MFKIMTMAVALAFSAGVAVADGERGATTEVKGTNSEGSIVGRASSVVTGNGDVIGGNGTTGADQTTAPGSRAAEVQGLLATEGRGWTNSNN